MTLALTRRLAKFIYRRTRIILLAIECSSVLEDASPAVIIRKEQFENDEVLPRVMQQAGTWNLTDIKKRQQAGDICYQVMEGTTCLHYCWVSRRAAVITEIGYTFPLHNTNRWIYDAYTVPSHRGGSLFRNVLRRIITDAGRESGIIVWVGVDDTNHASRAAITKSGFHEVAFLERTVLFSSIAYDRKKTIVKGNLGERFDQLRGHWL